jgi:hypothetical protein
MERNDKSTINKHKIQVQLLIFILPMVDLPE